MCILCVVQKWSRRVATMLPWLVIPLIGLWALSQLLPPGFRFEVTSPRLACVLVLLVTLFWYEILMPQLSAWRVRRSARLIERKRFEAIEMEKLRKLATRRCRNCLTPYRNQNPGGGRFMCSYCGHISKRPVLDMPGPITNSGIIGELVGKSGKIWNGKVWSENGWICGQDWLENGNWAGGSFVGKSSYWGKNGGGFCNADDHCLAEQSYSGVVVSVCKLLASFFLSVRWLWRKIFRIGSTREVASSDAAHKGLSKKGENGMNFNESRVEKARRKAEEKRQARLEKELLEEEERKQREEVARLVDERRRLRDEKMEAEQDRGKSKSPATDRERDGKRDAERRRRERRKEKDKGSSRSNSDGEELEKRAGRENEKKREFDKRSESERQELLKTVIESIRAQRLETGHGVKAITTNNFSNGSTGARYFDRVKGSFLSSSKALGGASFFGKGAHTSATVISKASKPNGFVDHKQSSANWREVHSTEHIAGQLNLNGDDKITDTIGHHPVASELQPQSTPKKSWQQLFTRSSIAPSSSNANTISRPNQKPQTECQSSQLFGQPTASHPFDNPMHFGLSLPFTLAPFSDGSVNSTSVSSTARPIFPLVREPAHEFIPEEPELFEDPCYDPDPEFLLGPVSESLDNFPLDLGTGFATDSGLERPHTPKNVPISAEVNRPSPIESPMSRLRVAEERHTTSNQFPCTPKAHDLLTSPIDESSNAHEPETWQMWGTPSLGQDGLSFVGGPTSWLLSLGQNKNQEDVAHPSFHKAMIPQFAKENGVFHGTYSPLTNCLGHCQNGGTFGPPGHGSNDSDPWLQKSVFQPVPGDRKNHFPPLNPQEDVSRKEMTYGTSGISATSHPSELSPVNCWSKRERSVRGSGEGVGNSSQARPHIGGLFSTPDVQSLWSFN